MAGVGVVVSFLLLLLLVCFIEGWVLSLLWGWYMVPLGIPQIGVWHGVGIAIVAHFLTHSYTKHNDKPDWVQAVTYLIVRPFLALGFGWLIHFLM